ncbi:EAL domain-containing protein [Jeongeupia naejangsanensis]|uniref:cyclic-guanylate-specific phosphodiesterase n=1 Tax=Jeongeupia naejangsanensis TaxID=613195 RepID=A0ABS2BF57_9NEIS|nr:EAL domain-containing protein [Jeongeupia naejangsanensis]MBM3114242.1 EAL domain-containing protein [Jeongeupia naejangsanensis]
MTTGASKVPRWFLLPTIKAQTRPGSSPFMPRRLALLLFRNSTSTGSGLPQAGPGRGWAWSRVLMSVLVALPLPIFGIGIGVFQAQWQLQRQADRSVAQTIERLDLILDSSKLAAEAVQNMIGKSCDMTTRHVLQWQAATNPYVRSINLARGGRLYCASLVGPISMDLETPTFIDGRLRLMTGNFATPNVPLLVTRHANPAGSALAVVDGRYLLAVLQLAVQEDDLYLKVGDLRMGLDGRVSNTPIPALSEAFAQRTSSSHPYTVIAGARAGSIKNHLLSYTLPFLALALAGGLFSGLICYRLLGRPSSPRTILRRALEAKQFEPFLQPIVDARDGGWIGAEVLMRWHLPGEGLIRPDLFIPMAERTGLILPMTRDLMQQVASVLAPHAAELPPRCHIGFNISAAHCHDPQLLGDCRDFLAAFPPGTVELWLELTERELIEPTEDTDLLFQQLDAIGVKVAIDDFGIGHASLNYLQRFTVNALKIDQSFVKRIGADTLSAHLLDTLVELAIRLDIDLVAEGVETAAQRDYLRALNVRYLQGYLFGRPMPIREFLPALHQHRNAVRNTIDHQS